MKNNENRIPKIIDGIIEKGINYPLFTNFNVNMLDYDLICDFTTELWLRSQFFKKQLMEKKDGFNFDEEGAKQLQEKIISGEELKSDIAKYVINATENEKLSFEKTDLKKRYKNRIKDKNELFLLVNQTEKDFVISEAILGTNCDLIFTRPVEVTLQDILPISPNYAITWVKKEKSDALKGLGFKNHTFINKESDIDNINLILSEYAELGICSRSKKSLEYLLENLEDSKHHH